MSNPIEDLATVIKECENMSEEVTWYNTDEDNKMLNEVEEFLIMHHAKLQAILHQLKKREEVK